MKFTVPAARAATPNPFGGSTPFAPVVLAKFGSAIIWKSGRALTHNADANIAAKKTDTGYEAAFNVAEGAQEIAIQIGNSGQSDGSYNNIQFEIAQQAAPPVSGTGEVVTPPDPVPATPAQTTSVSSGGCSSVPNAAPLGAWWAAGLIGLVVAQRRRTSPVAQRRRNRRAA